MGETQNALAGIFNVNKPAHMTSHDVVQAMRRMSGQRRMGHAGTLDPMATGVLVICAGWATRLSEYLMEGRKQYRATLRFGYSTDTYDAEGAAVGEPRSVDFGLDALLAALPEFTGAIEQTAPAYSALKQDGVPLYKRARRGQAVTPPTRRVEIHELRLFAWNSPEATLDVVCSKGTYIRSLAHDLGQRLGCGAHLSGLVRTASGAFRLEEAISLHDLAEAFAAGRAQERLSPLARSLPDLAVLTIDADRQQRIHLGQSVEGAADWYSEQAAKGVALAVSPDGEPLAILTYQPEFGRWRPTKVFC